MELYSSSPQALSVVPLESHQFDLACQEFHDALALRYRKPLLGLPPYCDGCGAPFSVNHALDCWVGGLVTMRYLMLLVIWLLGVGAGSERAYCL